MSESSERSNLPKIAAFHKNVMRCGVKNDKGMLRLGHVDGMSERRLTKHIYKASASGRGGGRPRRTYRDPTKDVK